MCWIRTTSSDGRKQTVTVAGKSLGTIEGFQKGRWLEQPLTAADTKSGKILIRAENARQRGERRNFNGGVA